MLGAAGAALFYGDAMITPGAVGAVGGRGPADDARRRAHAINEGIDPARSRSRILIGLFLIQSRGTARVSALFGPVCILWFVAIGGLGLWHIADEPCDPVRVYPPTYGVAFLATHGVLGLFVLGAVFLTVTGAEALTADMGHFGTLPIRLGWFAAGLAGAGAQLSRPGRLRAQRSWRRRRRAAQPFANEDWFFLMAPEVAAPVAGRPRRRSRRSSPARR